jgi:hypothetical protein
MSRCLIRREDTSRIVGFLGEGVTVIENKTGALLLIADLPNTDNETIIIISGQLRQVTEAFNMITEVRSLLKYMKMYVLYFHSLFLEIVFIENAIHLCITTLLCHITS